MAPEVFDGRATEASDVFSLAATLFELTTGERPFPAADLIHSRDAVCVGRQRPDPTLAPLPVALADSILDALAPNPAVRPDLKTFVTRIRSVRNPTAIELAKRLLDKASAELGASGYMFCVRDPESMDDYRVVLSDGVKYPEMLEGFMGFASAQWAFPTLSHTESEVDSAHDEDMVFCNSPRDARQRLPKNRWFTASQGKKHFIAYARMTENETKRVYGPYFVRENLKGLALLHGRYDNQRCHSVYLNFHRETAFSAHESAYFRRLNADLSRLYPQFCQELNAPIDARAAARLLKTCADLANLPINAVGNPFDAVLQDCLTRFLDNSLQVLGVDRERGVATLNAFNSSEFLLFLVAKAGSISSDPTGFHTKPHLALHCEGVVSWVALHRRAIRIPDVRAPHIAALSSQIDPRVRSSLALPMFAGDELFGVLNFESFDLDAFSQSHLIMLSLVVNSVADAWRGCLRRRVSEDLVGMYAILRSHKNDPDVIRRVVRQDT